DPALDGVRVLVLTTFDEDEHVHEAIRARAAGYLLKDIAPDALRAAIRPVAAGDALRSRAVTAAVMRAAVAGGALAADRRPVERRHRLRAVPQPRHLPHLREPAAEQARCPRPGRAGGAGVRDRAGAAGAVRGVVQGVIAHLDRSARTIAAPCGAG